MLLGVIFRLSIYNLEPLFMDSAYYASLGRSIAEGDYLLQVNQMSDKPPLFFYVQALFFQLLGVSESVAVLPSFLGGMISIGIIYLLGRDLKNPVACFRHQNHNAGFCIFLQRDSSAASNPEFLQK